MGIDFKRSYESVFKSEHFLFKLLFPTALCLTSLCFPFVSSDLVLPYYLLLLLAGCVYAGFSLDFMHNEIHGISPTLPRLKGNSPRYLKSGFKMGLVTTFYFVLLSVIAITLICLSTFILVLLASKELAFVWMGLAYLGSLLFICIMHIVISGICADSFCFKEAFNVNKIFSLIATAKKEFLVVCLVQYSFALLMVYMELLLIRSFWIFALAPFATVLGLMSMNLDAQVYKTAKHRLDISCTSAEPSEHDVTAADDKPVSAKVVCIVAAVFLSSCGMLVYWSIMKTNAHMSQTYTQRAFIESNARRFREAEALCQKAISLDSGNKDAYMTLADVYLNTYKFDLALKSSEKALLIDPNEPIALENMADAYKGLGNNDKADFYYKKARKISPDIDMIAYFQRLQRKVEENLLTRVSSNRKDSLKSIMTFCYVSNPRYRLSMGAIPDAVMVKVIVNVKRSGKVGDLKIVRPSGVASFDAQVVSAVKSSSPLLPLPEVYKEKDIELEILTAYPNGK